MWDEILNKESFLFIVKEAEDDPNSVDKFYDMMSKKPFDTYTRMIVKAKSWEETEIMEQIKFATSIVDEMNISRFLALMDYIAKRKVS